MSKTALSQRDPRWRNYNLGEEPGGPTIGQSGCLVTCLTMICRARYGTGVIPSKLNDALARAGTPFVYDHYLDWKSLPPLFHKFTDYFISNRTHSAVELAALQVDGWDVALRQGVADNTHFMYLSHVDGGRLWCFDPWDGKLKRKNTPSFTGIRALRWREPPRAKMLVGYHDSGSPFALLHRQVQHNATRVDCGPQNIVRLNWGYANGTGTLPPPEHADAWVQTIIDTVKTSPPALLWHFGNEQNNPSEWNGGYPEPTNYISPSYYVQLYNAIADGLPGYPIAPAPLDPFNVVAGQFGQPADPREWAEYIYEHITRADGICLHAKTQTNALSDIDGDTSWEVFGYALAGRSQHLRTIGDQLDWIPSRFASLPVYVTELNPQWRVRDVELGWYPENDEWVHRAHDFILETYPQVHGICFYRHDAAGDQANFGMRQFPALIEAVESYIER